MGGQKERFVARVAKSVETLKSPSTPATSRRQIGCRRAVDTGWPAFEPIAHSKFLMSYDDDRVADAFHWIPSQTSSADRAALLSLRDCAITCFDNYTYLEIGSHLGGSLQPHIAEPRCVKIYSIDPRPEEQPDQHILGTYKYEGNSTARMIEHLKRIPGADVEKLVTFEKCSWDVQPDEIPRVIDLAFVDGEHTNRAVRRDFEAVERFLSPRSILAFHDFFVTPHALLKIRERVLSTRANANFLHFPGSNVVCLTFDETPRLLEAALKSDGWTAEKPSYRMESLKLKWLCRWNEFRNFVKSRHPRFARVAIRVKNLCRRKSKAN
jgi:hypothetical protein